MKKNENNLIYVDEKWKQIQNSKYEVSNYGRIKRNYKNKSRILSTFRKGTIQIVKIKVENKAKDYNVAKLVIESFIRKLNNNEVVYHKNQIISDNRLQNLEIITRQEAGKRTGSISKRKAVILLNDENDIIKVFQSAREAGKFLYMSGQTVCDYCNGRVQKKTLNLIWAEKLI